MKLIIFLSIVALSMATNTYNANNDHLDIDTIVANVDKLRQWYECFVENKYCDPVQSDFKGDMPEAIEEACAKCTDAQKRIFRKFLAALKEKLPKEFEKFKARYDPENKFLEPLEKAIASA